MLSQTQVAPETNEAKKALTLLKQLVFEGQVVVGDAMFCRSDVELVFATAEAFLPSQQRELSEERARAATLNKAHGRVEHRELTSSTMLNDHLDWPGVKQVLAGVRNLVINWLRSRKVDNLAAAIRENVWHPQPLFATLGKQNQ